MEVNSEPSTSSMIGEVIRQVTASSVYYISTHLRQNKVSFSNISKEI